MRSRNPRHRRPVHAREDGLVVSLPGDVHPGAIGYKIEWTKFGWPRAELNHRHKDFQSSALPTELPSQNHCPADSKYTFALFRLTACILFVYSFPHMQRSGTRYNVVERLPRRKADKFNKVFNDSKERVRSLWERKGVFYA